jgi:hypothetical protein
MANESQLKIGRITTSIKRPSAGYFGICGLRPPDRRLTSHVRWRGAAVRGADVGGLLPSLERQRSRRERARGYYFIPGISKLKVIASSKELDDHQCVGCDVAHGHRGG